MSLQDADADGHLAALYALIHAFLTSRSHGKAAAAVKKAAKDIVVLKDDVKCDGAPLEEIIKWWRAKKEADSKNECSSNSDSSSDSESCDSNDSVDSGSDSSSSSSNTNASNEAYSTVAPQAAEIGFAASKSANATSANRHSHIAGPSVELYPKTDIGKAGPQKKSKDRKPTIEARSKDAPSSDSGDSDNNSSSPEQRVTSTTVPATVTATVVSCARPTKKRRTSANGNAVVTAVATTPMETTPAPKQKEKANGKQPRKSNTPFQRIKADAVEFQHERLKDNAFMAKGGTANDYGARANQDLIVTRGDGFRKEKNKKKRGSYRGGEITMESHSIKFT